MDTTVTAVKGFDGRITYYLDDLHQPYSSRQSEEKGSSNKICDRLLACRFFLIGCPPSYSTIAYHICRPGDFGFKLCSELFMLPV